MGKKHPAYNLRTNKAIDRLLLAEILCALHFNGNDCSYYSFGGPFLDDLRVMDHYLPEMNLTSIESDFQTYQRQLFHKFNSKISLLKTKLSSFLSRDYKPSKKDVFWLDYTGLRYPFFEEFEALLNIVPPESVIRITLRAEPEFDLQEFEARVSEEELKRLRAELEKNFDEEFQKVLPHPSAGAFASRKEYARMIQLMVKKAASIALDFPGSELDFLPIQTTLYNDNTQMLSVTGIIYRRKEIENTLLNMKSIRYCDHQWGEPKELNIPNLSMKERLKLEHKLPIPIECDAGEILYKELNYCIDKDFALSKQQLSHYAEHFRNYPNFVRVSM